LGALGEGTAACVAVRCGPDLIRLILFFQKAKLLRFLFFLFLVRFLSVAGVIQLNQLIGDIDVGRGINNAPFIFFYD